MEKLYLSLLGFSLGVLFVNHALGQANYLTPYAVTTIAGTPGISGSVDGANGNASFAIDAVNLCGLVVDTNGSVYVADTGNSTIRRLTPVGANWMVTTIAGQPGTTGSADGTNTAATFNYPTGLTMDSSGNLYVLDAGNYLVREISPLGTNWVTKTVAAFTGGVAEWAITCDRHGNLFTVYASDTSSGVQEISPTNNWQVVSIASHVTFDYLQGIAVDTNDNLYVVDALAPDIQKLSFDGTNWVATIIAGTPGVSGYADGTNNSIAFYEPESIAVDNQGNLYVADSGNQTIRMITQVGPDWVSGTIAGISAGTGSADGVGINASFYYPAGIALDNQGNFYVGDTANDTIRMGSAAKLPLAIARFGSNTNLVSWPGAASYTISDGVATATNWISGGTLQSSTNLAPASWVNYAGAVAAANGTNIAIITPVTGNQFFRLTQ